MIAIWFDYIAHIFSILFSFHWWCRFLHVVCFELIKICLATAYRAISIDIFLFPLSLFNQYKPTPMKWRLKIWLSCVRYWFGEKQQQQQKVKITSAFNNLNMHCLFISLLTIFYLCIKHLYLLDRNVSSISFCWHKMNWSVNVYVTISIVYRV